MPCTCVPTDLLYLNLSSRLKTNIIVNDDNYDDLGDKELGKSGCEYGGGGVDDNDDNQILNIKVTVRKSSRM